MCYVAALGATGGCGPADAETSLDVVVLGTRKEWGVGQGLGGFPEF